MKIRSLLNGGLAEVDDVAAEGLISSGHWVADEVKAVEPAAPRRRAPRAKVVPADSGE